MKFIFNILLACLSVCYCAFSQDTIFVQRHHFDQTVYNVFQAQGNIFVKAGSNVYEKTDNDWKKIKQRFERRFVFFDSAMYDTEFLPTQFEINAAGLRHYLPQYAISNCTIAREGERLFVAVGGSLYEYIVDLNYSRQFHDASVRDIFKSSDLEVISTYTGVYIKDKMGTRRAKGVYYSSGKFWRTPEADYLLVDELYQRFGQDSFGLYKGLLPNSLGKVRKGTFYNGKKVLQLTFSICWFTPDGRLVPFFTGHEFTDIEVNDSSVLFSTISGDLFQSDGKYTRKLVNANSPIKDIFQSAQGTILATRQGLLKLNSSENGQYKLEPFVSLPNSQNVIEDTGHNLWVSTENGLYVIPNGKKIVLPFIRNVEFNRGALTFNEDRIYAGSIQGLYVIDYFKFATNFLPKTLNTVKTEKRKKWLYISLSALAAIMLAAATVYYLRRRKQPLIVDMPAAAEKPASKLSLQKLEADIREQQIKSVDEMAAFYETNTVQLNRIMKAFETTPGKFLKQVKLKIAQEMLDSKATMEEIVNATGYSAQFIRSELKQLQKQSGQHPPRQNTPPVDG